MMIDEMSLGLSPKLVKEMFAIVRRINQSGTTVLLVEQNARQALQQADLAIILESGQVAASGEAASFLSGDTLQSLYLGQNERSSRERAVKEGAV